MNNNNYTFWQWIKDVNFNYMTGKYKFTKFDIKFMVVFVVVLLPFVFLLVSAGVSDAGAFISILIFFVLLSPIVYPIGWIFKKKEIQKLNKENDA